MNKLNSLMVVLTLAACAVDAGDPAAAHSESWAGQGTLFQPDGTASGEYRLELNRTPKSEGVFEQDVKVLIPNREPLHIRQRLEEAGNRFHINTDSGAGSGFDLGEGLLTTQTPNPEGGFSLSSIFLEGDEMRMIRYEVRDGQVTRIFRETLVRK